MIQFSTLGLYDEYMPLLLDEVLEEFAAGKNLLWQIHHPWWPFFRQQRETTKADYTAKYGAVRYLSPSSTPVDKWICEFYKGLGVMGILGKSTPLAGDIWICEDILIYHGLPPEIEQEVDSYFKRAKSVDNFDAVAFRKSYFSAKSPTVVRVLVAPGLTARVQNAFEVESGGQVLNA